MNSYFIRKHDEAMQINQYSEHYNILTRRILMHCIAEHPGENIFISPLSVLLLLSIAADTTAGKTREEIMRLLNSRSGDNNAGKILAEFQKCLAGTDSFASANAIYARPDCVPAVHKSCIDLIRSRYNGEFFTDRNMTEAINQWIGWKTRGMIGKAADESMKDMLFCLINAVSFESAWNWPFEDEDIKERYFHNADGSRVCVPMLHGSEDEYIENDLFTGFIKLYKESRFAFMALLPREKAALSEPTELNLTGLFRSARRAVVDIRLPEFRFEFSQNLASFCAKEGIHEIWSDHADFSPLSADWLRMEAMLHKTFVEVNKAGTRAAAVTPAAVAVGCLPPGEIKEVFLDRPFLFAIIHTNTGIPVFAGQVNRL